MAGHPVFLLGRTPEPDGMRDYPVSPLARILAKLLRDQRNAVDSPQPSSQQGGHP